MIGIEMLDKVTDEVVDAFGRLLPQLSNTAEPLDADAITTLITSPAVTVLLARGDGGTIIGTPTPAMFSPPTGARASIEDGVVDAAAARHGARMALGRE